MNLQLLRKWLWDINIKIVFKKYKSFSHHKYYSCNHPYNNDYKLELYRDYKNKHQLILEYTDVYENEIININYIHSDKNKLLLFIEYIKYAENNTKKYIKIKHDKTKVLIENTSNGVKIIQCDLNTNTVDHIYEYSPRFSLYPSAKSILIMEKK